MEYLIGYMKVLHILLFCVCVRAVGTGPAGPATAGPILQAKPTIDYCDKPAVELFSISIQTGVHLSIHV